jgi:hypothetical protein
MKTRHLETFGEEVCSAYEELAGYKWEAEFVCSRPGCGHTIYYEGSTPYSRRCSKCKRDESATANTVFHKQRMSLPACLELVRMVMDNAGKQKIEELTDHLKGKGYEGVNVRSVWALLGKVYQAMKVEPVVFDLKAIFIMFFNKSLIEVYCYGKVDGKKYWFTRSIRDFKEVYNLIKAYTQENTITSLYSTTNNGSAKGIKTIKVEVGFRNSKPTKTPLEISPELYSWHKNLKCRAYKKNENTYNDLMFVLARKYELN